MAFILPNIVIKPFIVTLFHGDCPLCAPLPQDSGTPKYLCDIHEWNCETRKGLITILGTLQFTSGLQLAQYCDQTRSLNAISRRSPPVYSLALRLRNTKVPVWTHESIGYPKMDISHWDAAIHYGVQLAQYCDQNLSCSAISRRLNPLCSLVFLRLQARDQSTCVDNHEWNRVTRKGWIISHWARGNATMCVAACPMADVHFRVPYGLRVHTGTFVFLSLRAREHRGGSLREIA